MKDLPTRRNHRHPTHDHLLGGIYLITICVAERIPLLSEVSGSSVALSQAGKAVEEELEKSLSIRPNIKIFDSVIMPDHIHFIIQIGVIWNPKGNRSPIANFIAQFKAVSTGRINRIFKTEGAQVWQRGYHDRILRNEEEVIIARKYILENPQRWKDLPSQ